MRFDVDIEFENMDFLSSGMTGPMRDAVSLGVRDSLAVIEKKHKGDLFVRGQAKNLQTFEDKIVWRTGALAKSYRRFWKRGDMEGAYGSTLRRASVLERGAIIRAKNAPYLHFKIGDQWIKTKQVEIRGRFLMDQIEDDQDTLNKVDRIMGKAFEKGIDDAG